MLDKASIRNWDELWSSRYEGQLMLKDDSREVLAMALTKLSRATHMRSNLRTMALEAHRNSLNLKMLQGDIDRIVSSARRGSDNEIISRLISRSKQM